MIFSAIISPWKGIPIWVIGILFIWIVVGLFDPLIAGEGSLIGYHFSDINTAESLLPPFSEGHRGIHLLGTDKLGRDVAAAMVHGARVSVMISFGTILLSLIFGSIFGLISGYFGNQQLKKNLIQQFFIYVAIVISIYYLFYFINHGVYLNDFLCSILFMGVLVVGEKICHKLPIKKYGFPIDFLVQRLFELREVIPGVFIVLILVSTINSPSYFTLILVLTLLIWLTFARHIRAETLLIREQDYITSARAIGMTNFRLIFNHILPNAAMPIIVIIVFAMSGVILLESTLSFLGIGLPIEEVSWGKLMAEARLSQKAWWLAVFPGLAIFFILYALNRLGDALAVMHSR